MGDWLRCSPSRSTLRALGLAVRLATLQAAGALLMMHGPQLHALDLELALHLPASVEPESQWAPRPPRTTLTPPAPRRMRTVTTRLPTARTTTRVFFTSPRSGA